MDKKDDGGKISGIPAEGLPISQGNEKTEPYREEREGAFGAEGEDIIYAEDYFDQEEDRLTGRTMHERDQRNWSEGLQDEENDGTWMD